MKNYTRQQIIDRARKIVADIDDQFEVAAYWNKNTRLKFTPLPEPIDPDPDGELKKWRDHYAGILANEIRISEPKHKG